MTRHELLTLCETIRGELLPSFPELQGVRFDINTRYRTRAGTAVYATREVKLSAFFFVFQHQNDGVAHNTIRHELAHIVAYARFGVAGMGHGHMWRWIARSMGCNAQRCTLARRGDETPIACRFCPYRSEAPEKNMRKWERDGRQIVCKLCKHIIPYPWRAEPAQMAAEMPKRNLIQKT